jgi:leucyl/phenylalanyl-tRNA--protein transferase
MPVFRLTRKLSFPPPHLARADGLLAVGGDLSPGRLVLAYRMGIFPWYSQDMPILWWSPDPRLVLYPESLHIPRRLRRTLKQAPFRITFDTAFSEVIGSCAKLRQDREGTWIVPEMIRAYCRLHDAGFAHSVEAWSRDQLVGGLYGVSLGRAFFGESMFSRVPDASKVAFVLLVAYLKAKQFDLIDCQVTTEHLLRFGASEVSRSVFLRRLEKSLAHPDMKGPWQDPLSLNSQCAGVDSV